MTRRSSLRWNYRTAAVAFDQYNNRTDLWEYDFGSCAPGQLIRHTHTDYLTSNTVSGTSYSYDTVNPDTSNPDIKSTIHQRARPKAQFTYAVNPDTDVETLVARALSSLTTRPG